MQPERILDGEGKDEDCDNGTKAEPVSTCGD